MAGLSADDTTWLPGHETPLASAAVTYAEHGIRIFPLRAGDKVPAVDHWHDVATCDVRQVQRWWRQNAEYNIGMPQGIRANTLTLDIDHGHHSDGTPKYGWDSFAELEERHGELPATLRQATPSGGEHLIFSYPDRSSDLWRNSASQIADDIDVRGEGGYIVLTPSIVAGRRYGPWRGSRVAQPPAWLIEATKKRPAAPATFAAELPDLSSMTAQEVERGERYAHKAIQAEVERLREAARQGWDYRELTRDGRLVKVGWNEVVFRVSCQILEFANSPWNELTVQDAWDIVCGAAPRDAGFDEADVLKCFRSALTRTAGKGRPMPAPRAEEAALSQAAASDRASFGRACTDLGNGERMADLFGDRFRYVATDQRLPWYHWNGVAWQQDATLSSMSLAKVMVKRIQAEAEQADPGEPPTPMPAEGKSAQAQAALRQWLAQSPANAAWHAKHRRHAELLGWAIKSQDASRITSAVKLFASEPDVAAELEDFDADRNLINFPNGVYNLATMSFGEHKPEYMLSRLMGVEYAPAAVAPRWQQYLAEVLPDPDVRGYVKRAMGYTLSGRVNEKAIFFLLGPRDTGKTIFIETMLSVFGSYGLTAADGLLRKKRDGTISNDVNDLKGFRLAITSETEPNMMLDEALIKSLAGGDTLRNRALYRGNEQWKPQCGLWLASNHHPLITGDDDAIWGRIKVVNFLVQHTDEPDAVHRKDRTLPDVLATERAGILNWLLEGYAEWRERGLDEPAAITVDSAMYQREQDTVAQWLEDYADAGWFFEADYARLELGLAYRHYERWCRENGHERSMLGKKRLGQRLRSRYGEPQKSGKWHWHGIGVREGSGCPLILAS